VPGLAALGYRLGPVVDGAARGDGGTRLASPPSGALGAATRQQLPELLALLPHPVDEGVDRLGGDGAQPVLLAPPQPAGDLLARPALEQPLADEPGELGITFEDGRALPPLEIAAFRVHRQVAALRQCVPPQLAADGRGRPAEPLRDRPQAQPLGLQHGQPLPFL
jgi:hypothetical protein